MRDTNGLSFDDKVSTDSKADSKKFETAYFKNWGGLGRSYEATS